MPGTPDPPAWQILPATRGHFRWVPAAGPAGSGVEAPPGAPAPGEEGRLGSRLPSMTDLLLQGSPKLVEGGGCGADDGGPPMFRTGWGRSITVRQSSVQKAMSVLESGGGLERGGLDVGDGCVGQEGFPMFRTGSGKSVVVKQSSIRKAAAVLEGENDDRGGLDVGNEEEFPLFRTGLGKSVTVKQSSIRIAAAVLEGEDDNKESLKPPKGGSQSYSAPTFRTGSGNSSLLKQSSINKAISVLQDERNMEKDKLLKNTVNGNCNFSNSLFQTGSGKIVNTSSGLIRATTLLGLGVDNDSSSVECFEHTIGQSNTNVGATCENSHNNVRWDVNYGTAGTCNIGKIDIGSVKTNSLTCLRDLYSSGKTSNMDALKKPLGSEIHAYDSAQHPMELQTARGRYISISIDALQRAKSLLGDPDLAVQLNNVKADQSLHPVTEEERTFDETSWDKENLPFACLQKNAGAGKHMTKILPLALSSSRPKKSFASLEVANFQGAMPNQVNAKFLVSEGIHVPSGYMRKQNLPSKDLYVSTAAVGALRKIPDCRPLHDPLADISNSIGATDENTKQFTSEKKRLGGRSSISPFKRPRISRFISPLESKFILPSSGSSMLSTSENCCCRNRVSTRYPFQFKRKNMKDFFGGPPGHHNKPVHLPDEVKHMNADSAEKYRFHDASGDGIGPDIFQNILHQSGAYMSNATKEWVANHYKWIVWKLACLERCYPTQSRGTYLTVSNVLEELKYRYEREVNYGHRSAIKRILDGDASPSSMVILCVSAICSYPDSRVSEVKETSDLHEEKKKLSIANGIESHHSSKIELTDGWYSLDAYLDVPLSRQLAAGKLFIGQKLRIWGAVLCGWVGPVSSLEAPKTASLQIHINGTYRAHWADPLGFCNGLGPPLAFRCIKGAGGKVPRTLIGLTRVYPVVYKERFLDGGSFVRSERMENEALQLYNQRRHSIAEDIMSEQHGGYVDDDDSEEGAKIFKILETAAEPEVLMADMSSEQLISFSNYQAKREAIRQSNVKKKIEKALEEAGLSSRDVTPFMRVRVVGLTRKCSSRKSRPREGIITIWNPSEKQKVDLVEGQVYSVAGLTPLNSSSDVIYLQGRGSSMMWKSMPPSECEKFEPFFTPHRSIPLSNLGDVPLAREFDTVAVIVHVGEVYLSGCQKKQWVFITDGSNCHSDFEEPYYLLAVSFCSPIIANDSSPLLSHTLSGTTVAFCNLVKRARDEMNHLWVAEATEVSVYFSCYNLPSTSYLKDAAVSAQKWAKVSCLTIQKLRERVLCIVGDHGV